MTYEEKLRAYIDHAFQELPDAEDVHDTKDELTADLLEHYAQAVNEGNEPAQAYEIALSHLGNLAEVVDALDDRPLPNPEPPEPPRPPHAPGHPAPPEPPIRRFQRHYRWNKPVDKKHRQTGFLPSAGYNGWT